MVKGLLFFVSFIVSAFPITAQITVDQNDFASAGSTVYLTNGQIDPFLNATATGPNHTWDFSNLRSNGQQQIDFLNVASTNTVYAFYYADVPFNANRANIALEGTDIPLAQILGAANPFTFYYKDGNEYRKVGYGSELAGLPVPVNLNPQDVIYQFPMNYGNTNTSNSSYSASVPGVANTVYTQTRVTTIDGWGTVKTPYGTFDVLRSKSEVYGNDSIFTVALNTGVNIPRSKVTEYKWIAKNENVPVLQINTSTVFGVEVINSIQFKDAKLSIVTDSIVGTLCPGSQVTVHYTSAGTFNPSGFLIPGNRFTVQLSDNSGSFANAVNIGNVTATGSGTITCTIPNGTAGGTGYKLRIVSSSPSFTGAAYGPFTIHPTPTASITSSGPTTICTYDSLELVANNGIDFQYQWQLNTSDISGATTPSYFATLAGDYTVVVSNVCGVVTSPKLTVTVDPDPVHVIEPSDTSTCDGSPITVTALNTSGASPVTYQWYDSTNAIPGATDSILTVRQTGNYSLAVTDGIGCVFTSTPLSLEIDSMPPPAVYTTGSTLFCPGESITLYTDTSAEFSYQWQLNGVDIPGANTDSFTTSRGGDYTLVVSDTCDFEVSEVTEVTVMARPVHSVVPSSPASCDGNPIVITASNISGASPVIYQWYENGNILSGEADSVLTVTAAGDYSLVVMDRFGCTFNSDTYPIVFDSLPAPVIYVDGTTTFCDGESVTFTTDTNANYTYQWQRDGTDITGATSYTYTATEEGNYTVQISIGGGCTATSTSEKVSVSLLPPVPAITQHGDTLVSTSATAYQWFLNGTLLPGATSQSYKPGIDGDYAVMITNANGCTNVSESFTYVGTGIASTANDWRLKVYPNPVTGSEFTVSGSIPFSEIQIFNTAGALIFQRQLNAPAKELLITDIWQRGVYFIKVKTQKGEGILKLVKI